MYSDLAYGAQGIQYFTYWTPIGKENFHNGPIGRDGKPTDVYQKLTQLNHEIKELSDVFLGDRVVYVAHTGNIPKGAKSLEHLPKPIADLHTDNIGAVVSILKNNGKTYLMVVNHDFTDNMNLSIRCMPGVSQVLKDGTSVKQNQDANKINIGPGDIALFSWPDSLDQ